MRLTRRGFLKVAGGAAIGLLGGCGGGSGAPGTGRSMPDGSTGALLRSLAPAPTPFSAPLPIPPVLAPVRRDATTDFYDLTQRSARAAILPGLPTEIWGYDGLFPGPTIEARRGRRVVVRHRNTLPVPTVAHLHGAVAPPDQDGYPTDLLLPEGGWPGGGHSHAAPGAVSHGSREYCYPNDQPAATLWYHDHRMDFTGPQVYRGLAGFHLIRDEAEAALPLPGGERDIPLMICDRSFAADGSFMYPSIDPGLGGKPGVADDFAAGVLGDINLVNGAAWPVLEVSNTRYRFR
ncbi:MAG TPA: multicopper oxidase domain-containing protein, partial [Herpetosiphonaceae bacterium]|nr:multicopper oxidase domain-containing protein [Herpetosiphonaceae bacterium]